MVAAMRSQVVIKKYGNRRLYDTAQSRYVTLEEVADTVRRGDDVRILDAKSNEDLTQATLAQIILESRRAAALLPVPLLVQLIRLGDEALGEFIGRWVSAALEAYLQAHGMAEAVSSYMPMATAPFAATNTLARMLSGPMSQFGPAAFANAFPAGFNGFSVPGFNVPGFVPPAPQPAPAPAPAAPPASEDDLASLRREVEALRRDVRRGAGNAPAPTRPRRRREA
ncbi:MAG: polyhydroxyalkanoate synthesis regulator DNA-binding domain-containing protein [Myxococcota bacterium]